LSFEEIPVPLFVKSFYSSLIHKKDTTAIGANLEALVFHKTRGHNWVSNNTKHPTNKAKPMVY